MITCDLGGNKYSVNMVSGRALREIGPASETYAKLVKMTTAAEKGEEVDPNELSIADALDTMVQWFCILFNNQFTPDDVYDNYPSDRLVSDMTLAILAVQNQATKVLSSFPTNPTAEEEKTRRRVVKAKKE